MFDDLGGDFGNRGAREELAARENWHQADLLGLMLRHQGAPNRETPKSEAATNENPCLRDVSP